MKKLLRLDKEDSVVGSRSDPDDKIATDLCSIRTTENRIAACVISTIGPCPIARPPGVARWALMVEGWKI